MKNVLIVFTVLAMATVANAGLLLSVNGVVNPETSTINLKPSETAVIDIHGANNVVGTTVTAWLAVQGLGTLDAGAPTFTWANSTVANIRMPALGDVQAFLATVGFPGVGDVVTTDIMDTVEPFTAPNGLLIDGLIFHCVGQPGDVVLTLFDAADLSVLSTVTIHQIPEPITFALLGLGGLFLRRRK